MKAFRRLVIVMAVLAAARPFPSPAADEAVCTIPVKILVDDKEPTIQAVWEKRYRQRLAAASAIIERHCRVRFEVVAVGTWTSDNDARQLRQLIDEFERKVDPAPARLAIGFTGQYETLREEQKMGGTHGPFRRHILLREWGREVVEPERLEMLVHELGHYLGAAHSPQRRSVMRPDISDRQSRLRSFQIGFDEPNALIMSLVGEQLRNRPLMHLCQLSPATKDRLRPLYRSLAAELPDDRTASRSLAMLDYALGLAGDQPERMQAVFAGARSVLQAVSDAARENRQLPEKLPAPGADQKLVGSGAEGEGRQEGDGLTEYYVRQAATAARKLPKDVAVEAFLLGLGAALDDSQRRPTAPADRSLAEDMDLTPSAAFQVAAGALWQQLESPPERAARQAALGTPTMHKRRDLVQHFALSAALTVLIGPQAAEGAGIVKELADARGGSGFSFADLSADLSGILFAVAIRSGKLPLEELEARFSVADFLPGPDGLKEGIGWDEFVQTYGFPPDVRLVREREALRQRVLGLRAYKEPSPRP